MKRDGTRGTFEVNKVRCVLVPRVQCLETEAMMIARYSVIVLSGSRKE